MLDKNAELWVFSLLFWIDETQFLQLLTVQDNCDQKPKNMNMWEQKREENIAGKLMKEKINLG